MPTILPRLASIMNLTILLMITTIHLLNQILYRYHAHACKCALHKGNQCHMCMHPFHHPKQSHISYNISIFLSSLLIDIATHMKPLLVSFISIIIVMKNCMLNFSVKNNRKMGGKLLLVILLLNSKRSNNFTKDFSFISISNEKTMRIMHMSLKLCILTNLTPITKDELPCKPLRIQQKQKKNVGWSYVVNFDTWMRV